MGRIKVAKELIAIDLDSPTSEAKYDVLKHRSCWNHVLATLNAQKKSLTKKDNEEMERFKRTAECFLDFPCRQRSKRKTAQKIAKQAAFMLNKKLDSQDFELCFQNLWKGISEDKRTSFAYFDSLWFNLYVKSSHREKVLTWIKKKHIFSKKYVLIPIVRWNHWNLLIFCNFGESLESETTKPCMLLLDSLANAEPKRLEPDIRKFVSDIYKSEDRNVTRDYIRKIPLLIPKVPQQRDDGECGNFVLYFIKLFMEGAPENFSRDDYPYFMKKDWFTPECLECFCKSVH
ncbi:hypothetical protein UlMin_007765 [Ulmus minor]